jgi:glycosyltransferase involved in cell wall biosynthesis
MWRKPPPEEDMQPGMGEGANQLQPMRSPRVVFGLPAYNHAHKLRETLDSLLAQTERRFCIIASDDQSTDETPEILAEYASRDDRLIHRRSESRLGYIGNARRCFEMARTLYPAAEYFAWASDHDVWHQRWLEALMRALDENPDAVVACPLSYRIDVDGSILSDRATECSTTGEPPSYGRFSKTFNRISPGNMIYGLMRADAVERAGNMPWQLLPDRLLLAELALQGTMVHVPEYLWYRRYRGLASIDRQIRASFLGTPPVYVRCPWWVGHTGHLLRTLVIAPGPGVPVGRGKGATYSVLYLLLATRHVLMRSGILLGHRGKKLARHAICQGRGLKSKVRMTARSAIRRATEAARRAASLIPFGKTFRRQKLE